MSAANTFMKQIYKYYILSCPRVVFRSYEECQRFMRDNWKMFYVCDGNDAYTIVRENLRTGNRAMFEQCITK